jgi:hypothetical protein
MTIIFLVSNTNAHQLYRHVGPNGEVYFTDQPSPDSVPVEISPINVTPALSPSRITPPETEKPEALAFYKYFNILSPTEDQGVRANDGNVIINFSLQPALKPGHTIKLKIDGEDGELVQSGESLTVNLFNVSRGLHAVQAFVLDGNENMLMHAGPVSFHVLRVAVGGRN